MASAEVRISLTGARQASREIRAKGRAIRGIMLSEFRGRYSRDLQQAMVDAAPHGKKPDSVKPGPRLRETIDVAIAPRSSSIRATARSNAVDPHSGYHYTGVTRLGHKKRVIRPLKRRGKGFKSLQFWSPVHGHTIRKPEVRGVVHAQDWVETGMIDADRAADAAGDRIGRRIITTRSL